MKAKCDSCPLGALWKNKGEFAPVLTEHHSDDRILIIGEAPGGHEVAEGRPFVGPSGQELQAALDYCGVKRDECQINNVIACRPPQNKLDFFMARLSRMNKKRKKEKKAEYPTPHACCKPRVDDEIRGFTKVICLGSTAATAIRGSYTSIMGTRGACEVIEKPWGKVQVAYTVHPAFVLRSPKWRSVFQGDIARAFRFFKGELTWKDPEIDFILSISALKTSLNYFREKGEPVAYDVETDARNPISANLRCVALSNLTRSIVIPFLSIDGKSLFFEPQAEIEIRDELARFLEEGKPPIIGHNAGQYDRLVIENSIGITPKLSADTLLLHLLADNEMPHNLGFVTSVYTDFVEAWKANHTALNAKDDRELWTYCAKDACATSRVAAPLARVVRDRDQWHLLEREHDLQSVGVGMQALGMRVDKDRLFFHGSEFHKKLEKNKGICAEIVSPEFNANSTLQLRSLLYSNWKLTPEKYNEKTGDPSTDDETLRAMITHHNLRDEQRELIQAVRMVRRYSKLLGTYIKPMTERLVLSDGRIHPAYNRLPATGRYSSSEPNAQNIPGFLRDIFIPEEGHLFVGADMDQLELRLLAEEANAQRLLKIINDKLDPHNENMEIVYGKSIWELDGAPQDRASKGKGVFKRTRGITKNVFYAWQYAASIPTIHQQVVSVEDDEGKLIYAHLTHRDVRDVVNGLKRAVPEIPKWWREIQQLYRRQGYIDDSIWQRRRDFKDEEKLNELVNHPIQSGGASIVHEAMLELVLGTPGWSTKPIDGLTRELVGGALPFNFNEKTGLVNQCHDSLLFEVHEDDAEKTAKILQAAMNRRRKINHKLDYTAEAEVGTNWLET